VAHGPVAVPLAALDRISEAHPVWGGGDPAREIFQILVWETGRRSGLCPAIAPESEEVVRDLAIDRRSGRCLGIVQGTLVEVPGLEIVLVLIIGQELPIDPPIRCLASATDLHTPLAEPSRATAWETTSRIARIICKTDFRIEEIVRITGETVKVTVKIIEAIGKVIVKIIEEIVKVIVRIIEAIGRTTGR
jgi:hypothetical protein